MHSTLCPYYSSPTLCPYRFSLSNNLADAHNPMSLLPFPTSNNLVQVAPAELEGLLIAHEDIADAAVIGITHDRNGEAPKAYVVTRFRGEWLIMF